MNLSMGGSLLAVAKYIYYYKYTCLRDARESRHLVRVIIHSSNVGMIVLPCQRTHLNSLKILYKTIASFYRNE